MFLSIKINSEIKNAVSTTYQYCAIGDSLTEGLKSYADAENPATFYEQPYPFWISKEYGGALTNIGKSSGRFGGDRNIDFQGQVDSVKFSNFGFVTIALGVNDWQNNISKETIQTAMRKGIDKILTDNSKIHIAGILPQNTVRNSFQNHQILLMMDLLAQMEMVIRFQMSVITLKKFMTNTEFRVSILERVLFC